MTGLKLLRRLTSGYKQKDLSQFLHRHLDNFIMTINTLHFWQFFSGSGQILQPGQLYLSPGLAKIAPWWLAAGTVSRLKYRMTHRRAAPPTLSAHTRWPLGSIASPIYVDSSNEF